MRVESWDLEGKTSMNTYMNTYIIYGLHCYITGIDYFVFTTQKSMLNGLFTFIHPRAQEMITATTKHEVKDVFILFLLIIVFTCFRWIILGLCWITNTNCDLDILNMFLSKFQHFMMLPRVESSFWNT